MKMISVEFEEELYEELEKVCDELGISKEKFAYEVLKKGVIKKDHQLEKIHDREILEENLKKVDGEDDWM